MPALMASGSAGLRRLDTNPGLGSRRANRVANRPSSA